MKKIKIILPVACSALIILFFVLDLGQYLSIDYLKQQQARLDILRTERPVFSITLFLFIYIAVTGLSLPGAAILTLAGGAIFGLGLGLLLASFASTTGASLAFLLSRYLFRDYVQQRFADRLVAVNKGIEEEGNLYLFCLRLVPVFPFFIINLVMGLTPIRLVNFFLVSQLGMLAGTAVFVNAGAHLATVSSPQDVLNAELLLSLALLGILPLLANRLVRYLRKNRDQQALSDDTCSHRHR